MSDERNLTPDQRQIPRVIRKEAFTRIPETCDHVRHILTVTGERLMRDLEIDPAEEAAVDAALSQAFMWIRDEVTQPFRTEQMQLLEKLYECEDNTREIDHGES
jgi:hypothetical protein